MSDLLTRITIDPARMHGHPCIRDLRITVADVLNFLSAGQSREEIFGNILISKVRISTRSSLLPRARLIILLSPRNRPCFFSSTRSYHYDIGLVLREKGAEIAKRVRPADAA